MTSLRSKLRDLRTHRAALRAHERAESMRHHPSVPPESTTTFDRILAGDQLFDAPIFYTMLDSYGVHRRAVRNG